jgi:DNA-binding NarL/FixJ family response regulator
MQKLPFLLRLSNTLLESTLHFALPLNGFPLCCTDQLPESERKPAQFLITDKSRPTDDPGSTILVLDLSHHQQNAPIPGGIAGVLCQASDFTEMVDCLNVVVGGGHYITPKLFQNMIFKEVSSSSESITSELSVLTRREQEIFGLMQRGLTIPAISAKLCISPYTAEGHRANIQRKLRLNGPNCLLRFVAANPVS